MAEVSKNLILHGASGKICDMLVIRQRAGRTILASAPGKREINKIELNNERLKMKNKNQIVNISFDFAISIIELYKYLCSKKEYVLSKQLLRSGNSIGANVSEAQAAQSKRDFISKMSISLKEAWETRYWIQLLDRSQYINDYKDIHNIKIAIESIIKILSKIIITSKQSKDVELKTFPQ